MRLKTQLKTQLKTTHKTYLVAPFILPNLT